MLKKNSYKCHLFKVQYWNFVLTVLRNGGVQAGVQAGREPAGLVAALLHPPHHLPPPPQDVHRCKTLTNRNPKNNCWLSHIFGVRFGGKDCGLCPWYNPWSQQGGWLEAFLYEAAQNFDVFSKIQDRIISQLSAEKQRVRCAGCVLHSPLICRNN